MQKILVFFLLMAVVIPALAVNCSGKTITVVPFVNSSGNHSLDYLSDAIVNMLTTDLKQSTKITVVTREDLDKILAENNLSRSELADPQNAQKLGKLLGADVIIAGSFISIGNEMRFDSHALDVSTGEVLSGQKITGNNNDVMAMVDQLSSAVIHDLTGEKISVASNTNHVKGNKTEGGTVR